MFDGILFFLKFSWEHSKTFIINLLFKQFLNIFASISMLILPQYILDSIFKYNKLSAAIKYVTFLLAISLFTSVLINIFSGIILKEKMKVYKYFQIYLSKKIMNVEYEELESSNFLNLKSKAEIFLYGSGNGFASILETSFDLLGRLITLIIMMGIISSLNLWIVIIIFIVILINTFLNSLNQKKNIKINIEKSVQERRSNYFISIIQNYEYGKEIRLFNISKWILKKYENQLDIMQLFYNKMANINLIFNNLILITSLIQQIASYWYLIKKAITGFISVGEFSKYLTTISSFSTTFKDIINIIVNMHQYTNYFLSFKEFIKICDTNKKDGKNLTIDKSFKIEFINVYFKYKSQQNYVLENISFTLNSNDKIALVGENGAGKSTIIKLLLRLYEPNKGVIKINDVDIWEIDYNQYISLFSSVFQDFKLFSFSIKDNITLNSSYELNDKTLLDVLTKLNFKDKMLKLHNGIDTYIYKDFDNNGYFPSGGESQKLAIARTIYRNSSIIILDEPTAALDPKAEYELYNQLDILFHDKLCIYITHRLSSTKFCNKIIVLKDGKIIESGSHHTLLMENGEYAKMFNLQASNFIY